MRQFDKNDLTRDGTILIMNTYLENIKNSPWGGFVTSKISFKENLRKNQCQVSWSKTVLM